MRWILFLLPIFLLSCQPEDEKYVSGLGFDAYVPVYNQYIETWVQGQIDKSKEELAAAEAGSPAAADVQKKVDRF